LVPGRKTTSTGLVNPDTTGWRRTRTAARSAADGVRGALAVVGVVRDGDVRATVVVVAGERGAVDDDVFGLSLLLHAARTTTAVASNLTLRIRIRIARRLREPFAYYPSP
jgi:hypothetical protein